MTICIFVHLGAPTNRALLSFVCSVRRHPSPALEKLDINVSSPRRVENRQEGFISLSIDSVGTEDLQIEAVLSRHTAG